MAVKIRLKRFGKIRSPHYRIVVADSRTKRDGRAIEEIGKYHPKNDPSLIEVNSERAQYWLSVGAQPTEAVIALLKRTGDWQKHSGDTSPSGVLTQPEKPNKNDAFNAALAEAGQEPKVVAVKTADGSSLTLAIDAKTGLPTRVVSMTDNAVLGDVAIAIALTWALIIAGAMNITDALGIRDVGDVKRETPSVKSGARATLNSRPEPSPNSL